MSKLILEIVQTHHKFLQEELPSLLELLNNVISKEGSKYPDLNNLKRIFVKFFIETTTHLTREENLLFPHICQIETHPRKITLAQLKALILTIEEEYNAIDSQMAKLKTPSKALSSNNDLSQDLLELVHRLKYIEIYMRTHTHLENNILFPRALTVLK